MSDGPVGPVADFAADATPSSITSTPAEYWSYLAGQYEDAAARAGGSIVKTYRIAGAPVRLNFAAHGMVSEVARALAHLEAPPRSAADDLTVHIWDGSEAPMPLPHGWEFAQWARDGGNGFYVDERYFVAAQASPEMLYMLDVEQRRALFWIADAWHFPYCETAAPLRPLLHEWLSRRGHLPVHGAAVGTADGGLLLVGRGGSGKSNAALSCLRSDLLYASDDFCSVSNEHGWMVHSLYATGKVHPGDLTRMPWLRPMGDERRRPEEEKAVFFLNEHLPKRLITHFPLRAVVLVRVAPERFTRIGKVSRGAALRALGMNPLFLSSASAKARRLAVMADLVRALPSYELQIGGDGSDAPARLGELLAGLR